MLLLSIVWLRIQDYAFRLHRTRVGGSIGRFGLVKGSLLDLCRSSLYRLIGQLHPIYRAARQLIGGPTRSYSSSQSDVQGGRP